MLAKYWIDKVKLGLLFVHVNTAFDANIVFPFLIHLQIQLHVPTSPTHTDVKQSNSFRIVSTFLSNINN